MKAGKIVGLEEDLKKMGLLQPYTVEVSAPHASYIEFGTDPHTVSKEGIKELTDWARLKLDLSEEEAKSAAYAIANKIRVKGTDPQPFVRPAIQRVETMIDSGEFNKDQNPLESIAKALADEMSYIIEENGTSRTSTLRKSIRYGPSVEE